MRGMVQSIKKRLIAVGVVLAVLGIGGIWWYATQYTKTPEYTIEMVQDAVNNHDKDKLYKYVDVDHILDTASDAMLDGIIEATIPAVGDTKDAISNLTKMFKQPVVMSLQTAVNNYVEQGTWISTGKENSPTAAVDADVIVEKLGLSAISFRKLDSMAVDKETGSAVAKVRIFQDETGEEFVLEVELIQKDDGVWQVYEITNFKEFVETMHKVRNQKVKDYLEQSAALMQQHDQTAAQIETALKETMANGSLGSNDTRKSLKDILDQQYLPEWQQRKADLEAMDVPEAAGTLHRLRLKICDARINYGTDYSKWMDDKKAATIRSADNNLKIARNLEKDAELLTKQVMAHVK